MRRGGVYGSITLHSRLGVWGSSPVPLLIVQTTVATAGARLWNSLPTDIVACDTLPQFRRELKTFLFRQSYPAILL